MIDRRSFLGLVSAGVYGAGVLGAGVCGSRSAFGQDWLGWRGPNRDGVLPGAVWPASLDADHLKLLWQQPLDSGYSGPIVAGNQVFVTETQGAKEEVVSSLDLQTGVSQWAVRWAGAMSVPFFAKSNGDWIRSTPACDGQTLYVGGMRDVLVALNTKDGSEKWRIDFPKQFGSEVPTFGFVCSPLIHGEKLYVQAGGSLAAIDRQTGKILWKSLEDGGGMNGSAFSSPTLATLHGRQQLLVQTRTTLAGVDPETGSKIWEKDIPAFRGMNILTPIVWNDCVFTSSYGGKSLLLEFDPNAGWSVNARWENKREGYMSSPIIIGDHIYLHLRNKRFTCLELATGRECWTTPPFGQYWSMISNGQNILALDQRGVLMLIEHNPAEFKLLGEREVTKEESWAHLAIAGDKVLVRHLKGIQCYSWTA